MEQMELRRRRTRIVRELRYSRLRTTLGAAAVLLLVPTCANPNESAPPSGVPIHANHDASADGAFRGDSGPPNGTDALVDSGSPGNLNQRFAVNECKATANPAALFTGRRSEVYGGLQCVAWSRDDEGMRIDLINFREGCGFQGLSNQTKWSGESAVIDGALRLRVYWNFAVPSACGECMHDFSFDLPPLPTAEAAVPLRVETQSCLNCPVDILDVPALGAEAQGIACRYAPTLLQRSSPGSLHQAPTAGRSCLDGLQPLDIEPGKPLCVSTCITAADCPVPEVFACIESACRLASSW